MADGRGLFGIVLQRFLQFALERGDDRAHVSGIDRFHGNFQDLFANVRVGTREGSQNVHQEFLDNLAVLFLEAFQTIENNQLDIVVVLAIQQIGVGNGGSANGCGSTGEADQGPGCLVTHGSRIAGEHLKQDPDKSGLLVGIPATDPASKFQDQQTKTVTKLGDSLLDVMAQKLESEFLVFVDEHQKGISAGGHVRLGRQELRNELGSVWKQVIGRVQLGNVENAQGGTLSYIRVSVRQAGFDGRNERPQNFFVLDLAQKPQHRSANVFVGVIQIVHQSIAHKDHFRKELAWDGVSGGLLQEFVARQVLILGDDLPVQHC
mmetsp:Transcript_12424/g.31294  ORF Transcript_12424/g.31294 Transcript_12424/m.31294 type:complete len:320 (-) Transcript_12424:316-1275(-)